MYCCLGRITRQLYLLLILSLLFGYISIPIYSNEAKAAALDEAARDLELKASKEKDPKIREELLRIAEFRREDARIEREKHFAPPFESNIIDTKDTSPVMRPYWKNPTTEDTFEVSLGYGSGSFAPSRGREYLTDPVLIYIAGGPYYPRTSLAYDNYSYYTIGNNPNVFGVHPINMKLSYLNNAHNYGFSYEGRGFSRDVSYSPWGLGRPSSPSNAILKSDFKWNENKWNFFYQENWSYNRGFRVILGLRSISTKLKEVAFLPNINSYRDYNEESYSLGPNLGLNYSHNFFGVFIFSSGLELSAGSGSQFYDSTTIRSASSYTGNVNFSYLDQEKPIDLTVYGGEFFGRFDYLISENNKLGVAMTYHHFYRITEARRLPVMFSNEVDQLLSDYQSFFIRNYLYNDESKEYGKTRYQILRWISLEYTHAF